MSNFDFESLHPSQKAAFIDGFLSGVLVVVITMPLLKEIRRGRRLKRQAKKLYTHDVTTPNRK
jgi:hypothetical protein